MCQLNPAALDGTGRKGKVATYEQRTQRGAELLDDAMLGWADMIDLDKLDLGYEEKCVLGQTFGSFSAGSRTLGLRTVETRRAGFYTKKFLFLTDPVQRESAVTADYACLKDAWTPLIRERQGALAIAA